MAVLRDRGHDAVLSRPGKTLSHITVGSGDRILDPQLQEVYSSHLHKRQDCTILSVGDFSSSIIKLDIISIAHECANRSDWHIHFHVGKAERDSHAIACTMHIEAAQVVQLIAVGSISNISPEAFPQSR